VIRPCHHPGRARPVARSRRSAAPHPGRVPRPSARRGASRRAPNRASARAAGGHAGAPRSGAHSRCARTRPRGGVRDRRRRSTGGVRGVVGRGLEACRAERPGPARVRAASLSYAPVPPRQCDQPRGWRAREIVPGSIFWGAEGAHFRGGARRTEKLSLARYFGQRRASDAWGSLPPVGRESCRGMRSLRWRGEGAGRERRERRALSSTEIPCQARFLGRATRPAESGAAAPTEKSSLARSLGRATPSADRGSSGGRGSYSSTWTKAPPESSAISVR